MTIKTKIEYHCDICQKVFDNPAILKSFNITYAPVNSIYQIKTEIHRHICNQCLTQNDFNDLFDNPQKPNILLKFLNLLTSIGEKIT